jgi:trimethylamine---corrinoid protein Co-methyltransferase
VDAQSGHEKTLTGLLPALAGANLIYGLGMLESGMTFDFGQLVMDHEFARFIKQSVAGIPVSDEMLMVEEIKKVGPFGDFLSLDSTMKYMRGQSQPKLIDRRVRDEWQAMGSTTIYERALVEARRILAEHQVMPLPDGAAEKMRAIVEEAELGLTVR